MSRVYALYQLPHPIPRAGFSLNRRQPEPSDRSRHPLAHPRSRQRHPPRQTLTPSPSFSLSIPLPPRISPSPVSLPPSLFSLSALCTSICRHAVCGGVCAESGFCERARSTIRVFVSAVKRSFGNGQPRSNGQRMERTAACSPAGAFHRFLYLAAPLFLSLSLCFPLERRKI